MFIRVFRAKYALCWDFFDLSGHIFTTKKRFQDIRDASLVFQKILKYSCRALDNGITKQLGKSGGAPGGSRGTAPGNFWYFAPSERLEMVFPVL
jgi:hypothetical protein